MCPIEYTFESILANLFDSDESEQMEDIEPTECFTFPIYLSNKLF